MKGISRIYTMVGLVLIISISPCFPLKVAQPQGPVKETQKVEQPVESIDELNVKLRRVVFRGQKERVKELILQGANINARHRMGMSLLHMAAVTGPKNAVVLLLNNGALVDARDDSGLTPLHYLAGALAPKQERDSDIVGILVNSGADINATDKEGLTALHHAAAKGLDESVVKCLIDHSADINASDKYGLTPLHNAVIHKCEGFVRLLTANGELVVDPKDNFGRTPLHFAAGADHAVSYRYKEWPTIVQLLLDNGADINAKDNTGWTPLRYVAVMPDNNAVKFLLERGADPYCVDNRGCTLYSWLNDTISYCQTVTLPEWQEASVDFQKTAEILRDFSKSDYCIFVSPDGKDTNPGTLKSPFKTIAVALDVVGPGDSVVVRGGIYRFSRTIYINKSGRPGKPTRLVAYPGEKPILDFTDARGLGIIVTGAYWHFNNLSITRSELGMRLLGDKCHHNILEELEFYENGQDTLNVTEGAAYNLIVNCNSYRNFNPRGNGGAADGFAVHINAGQGNVLIGNRAWNNSDDGFDLWNANNKVRLERCYAWSNGENIWNHPWFKGDANGFKLGSGAGRHIAISCIAWSHLRRGFDLAGSTSGVTVINCMAFSFTVQYHFRSLTLSGANKLCRL